MKYFRFICGLNPESPHDLRCEHDDFIREAADYCDYLGRMYEFYFPATRTDNVSSLTVCLVDKLPQNSTQVLLSRMTVSVVMDWIAFSRLTTCNRVLQTCAKSRR